MADPDALYELLPALYRERDAQQGEPLRALLHIIQDQADLVETDIARLWRNFFIETCDPWVVPYIGDLVANIPLFDASRVRQPDTAGERFPDLRGPTLLPPVAARSRADVAKTIYYRRRKSTLPMLEELARDVTGWAAHAVEFFQLLEWTQYLRNHLRVHGRETLELRRVEQVDRLDGPFDTAAHTVDVRPLARVEGRYNIDRVGFFLWRLRSYEAENVEARRVGGTGDFRYTFSPLGNPAPLFNRWRREGDEAGLATEVHVPGPIRPAAFYEDLERYRALPLPRPGYTDYYGLFDAVPDPLVNPVGLPQAPDAGLMIFRDGVVVPPEQIGCRDLSTWQQPAANVVGVDLRLGRIAFGPGLAPAQGVDVYYHYGFSADLGGGSYRRRPWLLSPELADLSIDVDASGATPGSQPSLTLALAQWAGAGRPNTVIRILDSRRYAEALSIEPADDGWLAIEAADGVRPHLALTAPLTITGNHPRAGLTLSGLLVEGWVQVSGSLGRLRLLHTTLVPGRSLTAAGDPVTALPSLIAAPGAPGTLLNTELRVEAAFSITGPLRIPAHAKGLWLLDSIADGVGSAALAGPGGPGDPGPASWLERCTVLGPFRARELSMASEVIFTATVEIQRRQVGCVRFSYLPGDSHTPRRYRCQPDLAVRRAEQQAKEQGTVLEEAEADAIRARLVPVFSARRYGRPPYMQLAHGCPEAIRVGAEDGSEMGAFCHLKQAQREANLRLRLEEYLPFGLVSGPIYVT